MEPPPPAVMEDRTAMDELNSYRSRTVFASVIVFTITATLSVILRLVAKKINRAKLQVEDYLIILSLILLYGMGVAVMLEIFLGSAGHHVNDIPPSHNVAFLKVLVAMQLFYGTILSLVKISICLFYIRIFFVKPFRIATWIVITFISCWGIMVILTGLLMCTPIAFNWDPTIPGGKCADQKATFMAVGILDLVTDLCVFVLPLPMIWKLRVSRGNKVALFGIFGLGLITMVISALRVYFLDATDYSDITYSAAYPLLWSFLEPSIGISVACGPLLRPLVRKFSYFRNPTSLRSGDKSARFGRLTEHSDVEHALSDYPATVTMVSRGQPKSTNVGTIGVQQEWETHVHY